MSLLTTVIGKHSRRACSPALWLGLALLSCAGSLAAAPDLDILFVSSRTSTDYLGFVDITSRTLRRETGRRIATTTLPADELGAGMQHDWDVIVSLGSVAARSLRKWDPASPVVYTLIPGSTYASLKTTRQLACPRDQCTAIYIDQPLERLFRITRRAFTGRRQLAVLLGPVSARQKDRLRQLADETGFSLQTATIHETRELLPALDGILKRAELLLSLPDPVAYNRRTAKSILLSSYRYRVPVIAYSKAYAEAGAALSIYSTPEQIAHQTARLLMNFFADRGAGLPGPQYPEQFNVQVNHHVSESLGLELSSASVLKAGAEGGGQ